MRVLVDTNIVLDYLIEREPFMEDAEALFQTIASGQIQGYVAAMQICSVDRDILEAAFASNLRDFEDAVQLACAIAEHLDAIITRNPQDFASAALPILSASELLESLS